MKYLKDRTGFIDTKDKCPPPKGGELEERDAKRLFPLYDRLAGSYNRNFPMFEVVLNNLIDLAYSGVLDVSHDDVDSILDQHRQAFNAAREYVGLRINALETEKALREYGGKATFWTEQFDERLSDCTKHLSLESFGISDQFPEIFKTVLAGDTSLRTRVLHVMPVERAQRVSTLASAASSLQTALSIAGTLPTAGLGINAGFTNLKNEIGKIEARERAPLVVGFIEGGHDIECGTAESQADGSECSLRAQKYSRPLSPRFGWVLGPPIRPHLSENRLRHSHFLKSHEIQVDLSVPAWWPSVNLVFHTAWAGPLGTSVEEYCARCKSKTFTVTLPSSDSDMDALTNFLVSNLTLDSPSGSRLPRIASGRPRIVQVSPTRIDRSAGPVTLIVEGTGLWRGEEVFVYGRRQTEVQVLPGMSGLGDYCEPIRLTPTEFTNRCCAPQRIHAHWQGLVQGIEAYRVATSTRFWAGAVACSSIPHKQHANGTPPAPWELSWRYVIQDRLSSKCRRPELQVSGSCSDNDS